MTSTSGILGREYGPLGIFGTIASSVAGPATSAVRHLCAPASAPKAAEASTKSATQLRYEADAAEVARIAAEQRNLLRGLSLCAITALCGASAFMQLAVLFWPVAVVMIWGAAEIGWHLGCEWNEGRKAYKAAVTQQRCSLDALAAEQQATQDDSRQQRYLEALRASQQATPRLSPGSAMGLRQPAAASALDPQNR